MKKPPKKDDAVKPGICITCHEFYDVELVNGSPIFYDHGTKNPHGCKS